MTLESFFCWRVGTAAGHVEGVVNILKISVGYCRSIFQSNSLRVETIEYEIEFIHYGLLFLFAKGKVFIALNIGKHRILFYFLLKSSNATLNSCCFMPWNRCVMTCACFTTEKPTVHRFWFAFHDDRSTILEIQWWIKVNFVT